ncbi:Hydantoin utilization protein C [Anatilimnocola aggregata]|uniref:Hydantoin utilization protein C n=1 Tax=Anatilimnocola aggregata TaxID=2528021 RepID=A0A517YDG5_9BACT|nr:allantoate amidohydrolase [Anatilimnocola aggregata]QDU28277.1 Hydantoin utilization protein C [Anatilimnocola aggregata]
MDNAHHGTDHELLAQLAHQAFARCQEAAANTEIPGQITRTFCSPAIAQLHQQLIGWMQSLGMTCRVDGAGNLWGKLASHPRPDAPSLIIGSHLDTVPNGGRYDGLLGVILGLALAEVVVRRRATLPFALEVVGFSEEEGVRFGTPFIGSLAVVGQCDDALLQRTDANGLTVRSALQLFGCHPDEMNSAALQPARVIAYLEPHIEQGPVLQSAQLPLGVVTSIAGQTRAIAEFCGVAGHAGTVPMQLRRDALAAAAEWILAVERIGQSTAGLVATVGAIEVSPGAGNVIPGAARAKLDVRHAEDSIRSTAVTQLRELGNEIAARRNTSFELSIVHEHRAAPMNDAIAALIEQSLADTGIAPLRLVSGAGHDAAVMARRFPTGMLFIRCQDGISHHPDETVTTDDITAALSTLWFFVQRLTSRQVNP